MKYQSSQPFGVGSTALYRDNFDAVFGVKRGKQPPSANTCDHGIPFTEQCPTCVSLWNKATRDRLTRYCHGINPDDG